MFYFNFNFLNFNSKTLQSYTSTTSSNNLSDQDYLILFRAHDSKSYDFGLNILTNNFTRNILLSKKLFSKTIFKKSFKITNRINY